jgi:hypothetical protein
MTGFYYPSGILQLFSLTRSASFAAADSSSRIASAFVLFDSSSVSAISVKTILVSLVHQNLLPVTIGPDTSSRLSSTRVGGFLFLLASGTSLTEKSCCTRQTQVHIETRNSRPSSIQTSNPSSSSKDQSIHVKN